MNASYERQLAEIAGRLPTGPAIVALVPTVPLDEAAALASDVAQAVGSSRSGHTILTSLESADPRLDHEIGVEADEGLTAVLAGRVTIARAAAHGRARRFIYLPAGRQPASGVQLLLSEAWGSLTAGVRERGGTVLAFVPAPSFVDAIESRAASGVAPFDALIWLGPAHGPWPDVRAAARSSGAVEAGSVGLPGGPASDGIAEAAPEGGAPDEGPVDTVVGAAPDSASVSRSQPGLVGVRRRRSQRRAGRHRATGPALVFLVAVGALALWAGYTIRERLFSEETEGASRFASPDSMESAPDSVPPDSVARDSLSSDSLSP